MNEFGPIKHFYTLNLIDGQWELEKPAQSRTTEFVLSISREELVAAVGGEEKLQAAFATAAKIFAP